MELILVFNYSAEAKEAVITRQLALMAEIKQRKAEFETRQLQITVLTDFDVPKKQAGVGHARKTGMDFAARSFAHHQNPSGIIASLDADCKVESHYFAAIQAAFEAQKLVGASIYFEHPLNGAYSNEIYDAISEYELHLRYYIQALRFAQFPLAYHTVGSCFACTAQAYVKAGGMPSKQAGEDFYFLQKVIPLGSFAEINSTIVYPSSRPSDRVPFGTGPSINTLVESKAEYHTFNLQAFIDLKAFLEIKDQLFNIEDAAIDDFTHQLSGRMRSYLVNSDFFKALKPINDNCSSLEAFQKRFYEVFNAFRVIKYLNYTHAHFLEKTPVFEAAIALYELQYAQALDVFDPTELLATYRQLEKK